MEKICLSHFRHGVDFYISLQAACVLSSLVKFKTSVGFALLGCLMGAALWQTFFHLCRRQMKNWFLSLDSMCSLSDSALEEGKVCSGMQSFGSQPGLPAALLDLGLSPTDQRLSSAKCLQKYPTVPWLCHAPYLLIQLNTDSSDASVEKYTHTYYILNLRPRSHIKYLVHLNQSGLDICPQV